MRPFPSAPNWAAAPGSLKRSGYILGLGGAVVALLVGLALEYASGQAGSYDIYLLPATAACLLILMFGFIRARTEFLGLEVATFTVLTAFFLVELGLALYGPAGDAHVVNDRLSEFAYWFPTLYASVLFILGIDHGWRITVFHFGTSLLVGLPYLVSQFLGAGDFHVVYSLSQLYLSSAVAIATVIIFARYTERVVHAKSEMERLAHTDFVTELVNRRELERFLQQEVRRAERYRGSLSLLILDIDHFKQVNDRFGHPVGDEVLREIAGLLRSESRGSDLLGRWGGEEFMLILPNTSKEPATEMAKRILQRVNSHQFSGVGKVTVSVGGATLEYGEQVSMLIARADAALYEAKEAGRNRVMVSEPQEESLGRDGPAFTRDAGGVESSVR